MQTIVKFALVVPVVKNGVEEEVWKSKDFMKFTLAIYKLNVFFTINVTANFNFIQLTFNLFYSINF